MAEEKKPFLNVVEKHDDQAKRIQIIRQFASRIEAMEKKTKMSRRKFCDKHKLHSPYLSKIINLKMIPEWDTIETIDKALKNEGV